MKFWEKFHPEQFKNSEPKSLVWWVVVVFGFLFGLLLLIPLGYFISLLWNYAVASIFNISELTTYTAAALLFLIFALIRIIKLALG